MHRMQGSAVSMAAMFVAVFLLYTNLPVVLAQGGMLPAAAAGIPLALMAVAAGHQLLIMRRPLIVDRTLLLALGLLCVFVVSTLNAVGYDVAIDRIVVFVTEGIVVYLLVRNAVRTRTELRAAMASMLLAAALLATLTTIQNVTDNYDQEFMGLAQRSYGDPNARSAETINLEDRARGPVDEPNRFAQVLLMAAPVGFILARNARRTRGRVAAATGMLLALGGVLLTYSRGAFVTLVILMLLAVPMKLLRLRGLVMTGAAAIVIMFVVVPGYVARVVSIAGVADLLGTGPATVEADGPTRGRTTEMLAALAAYLDHPVIGVGPGQYVVFHSQHYQSLPEISIRDLTEPRRAHNLYLEMAAETGTVGLLVFMAIPLLLLRDLEVLRRYSWTRSPERAWLAASFALVILSYLGTGVFLHLAYERYYWFMIGLAAATVGILREELSLMPETKVADVHADTGRLTPATHGDAWAC
ncbi:MAG: O-antigen ligase family protein [Gemmatimonadales bacterium]